MIIEPTAENSDQVYPYLTGVVNPRPIAWVSTRSQAGVVNLAPFSFYNVFGYDPPVVVFSPSLRKDGSKKDTLRNIEESGEFVVNASVESLAEKVNLTAKEIPSEESEVDLAGLHTVPSLKIRPPRIAESPVALECRLRQIIPIGSANLVIGEIVCMYIDDAILDATGQVDPRKLKTIARLGGINWLRSSDLFELPRPQ